MRVHDVRRNSITIHDRYSLTVKLDYLPGYIQDQDQQHVFDKIHRKYISNEKPSLTLFLNQTKINFQNNGSTLFHDLDI